MRLQSARNSCQMRRKDSNRPKSVVTVVTEKGSRSAKEASSYDLVRGVRGQISCLAVPHGVALQVIALPVSLLHAFVVIPHVVRTRTRLDAETTIRTLDCEGCGTHISRPYLCAARPVEQLPVLFPQGYTADRDSVHRLRSANFLTAKRSPTFARSGRTWGTRLNTD